MYTYFLVKRKQKQINRNRTIVYDGVILLNQMHTQLNIQHLKINSMNKLVWNFFFIERL